MNTRHLVLFSAILVALGTGRALADVNLVERDARHTLRLEKYLQLMPEAAQVESTYSGSIGTKSLWLNSFGNMVTGSGPHGSLQLNFFGNMVTGRSGPYTVRVTASGWMVTGEGPRGAVFLSMNGQHISGNLGTDHVSVSIWGSSASGFIGQDNFNLHGFDPLSPAGLAALLAAL